MFQYFPAHVHLVARCLPQNHSKGERRAEEIYFVIKFLYYETFQISRMVHLIMGSEFPVTLKFGVLLRIQSFFLKYSAPRLGHSFCSLILNGY